MGFSEFPFHARGTIPEFPIADGARSGRSDFDQQRVTGVRAKTPRGELEIRADLVIGADGRHSIIQACAGLERQEFGVAIDALWMRISKKQDDPQQSLGFFQQGKLLVLLDRGDYWQCGFVIPKGGFDQIKAGGLQQLQNDIASFAEFLRDRVRIRRLVQNQIAYGPDQSPTELVSRRVALHRRFCARDVAGGRRGNRSRHSGCRRGSQFARRKIANRSGFRGRLRKVQARREWPTRLIQAMQVFIHRRVVTGRTSDPKLVAFCFSPTEMVPSSPTTSRPLHWHRTASGALL